MLSIQCAFLDRHHQTRESETSRYRTEDESSSTGGESQCGHSDDLQIPDVTIDDFEYPNADSFLFDLSSQSDCRLYSGSSLSTFQALSILFSWFSLHPGISKAAFDHLLKILNKHFLPSDNELPTSYKDARKVFNTYLSPVVKYDCCRES